MAQDGEIDLLMAEEFRVFAVRGMPQWAVLQVTSDTGQVVRIGLHVDHLSGLGEQLKRDAALLRI